MGLLSWPRTRYRRRFRSLYNRKKFSASLRNGRISYLLFRDRIGLDVAARSALRLRKFELASRLYRKAVKRGWKLRDHEINHFEAEVKSGEILEAFKIANRMDSSPGGRNLFSEIAIAINRSSGEERDEAIRALGLHENLPEEIAILIPDTIRSGPGVPSPQSFVPLEREEFDVYKYRREVFRLRNSSSYKVGRHLIDTYRKPWRIPLLPFSLTKLAFNLIRERNQVIEVPEEMPGSPLMQLSPNRRSVVLFPTNGVGFGHFTRLLSLARRLRNLDPELEIVFFTTMPTLHILEEEGFPAYHIPGRYRFEDMEPREWNAIAEEVLSMIFTLHRPSAFIFDGAYPYRGMLNSLKSHQKMLRIWLRRGSIKEGSKAIPSDSLSFFDAVIKPGDSVADFDEDEIDSGIPIVRCNPITLFDSEDIENTGKLRKRMGIPDEALLAYVQLGAGKINNINSELRFTLEALNEHPHVFTVYGESILGERHSFDLERMRTLRDYPNSLFFKEFDFAIMAAGYNSFHEAVQSSLPTLCFPNLSTGRDDQLARAKVAREAGCMVVLESRSRRKIRAALERIVEPEVRELMSGNAALLQRENGSIQAAKWIIEQLPRT